MEKLGFTVLGEIDYFFLEVKLPEGWIKERDHGHPGWWLICDDLDRLRCQCMEGHANYETVVANWLRRYDYDVQWHRYETCRQRWVILDGGDILYESEWAVSRPDRMARFTFSNVRKAVAWLNRRFPQWRRLDAYW